MRLLLTLSSHLSWNTIIKLLKLTKLPRKQQWKCGFAKVVVIFIHKTRLTCNNTCNIDKSLFSTICDIHFCDFVMLRLTYLSILNSTLTIWLLITTCYKVQSTLWSFLFIWEMSKNMAKMICENQKLHTNLTYIKKTIWLNS